MEAIGGKILGGVVGGLMGGDDEQQQQTATKAPWEAVDPWLREQIGTGRQLQDYYQRQPFNRMQQQGYQNLFSDLDQFRGQTAPGLMNFANGMMTSNYQRGGRNSQMEAMQSQPQGMPMQGSTRPQMMQQGPNGSYVPQGGGLAGVLGQSGQGAGAMNGSSGWAGQLPNEKFTGSPAGLMAAMGQGGGGSMDPSQSMGGVMSGGNMSYGEKPQGLLGASQGVFQAPSQGNYGLLDWAQLNPFTATNGIKEPKKPDQTDEEKERLRKEEEERHRRQQGEYFRGEGA